MSNKLTVIGSANMDLIMQVDHLPKPGETVTGGIYSEMYGGKGANQAVAAARAGADVNFISSIGKDSFGDGMITHFENEKINVSHILRDSSNATGTALIMIDNQGENCISVAPGANYSLVANQINKLRDVLKSSKLVLLQGELRPDLLPVIIHTCRSLKIRTVVNLAPYQPLSHDILRLIDYLVVNEVEANAILMENAEVKRDPTTMVRQIRDMIGGEVILTLGSNGVVWSENKMIHSHPAYTVKAIDTTAAGDTFCGSLCAEYIRISDLGKSVRFATAASALSVQKLGAQNSVPTREEIIEFMDIKG